MQVKSKLWGLVQQDQKLNNVISRNTDMKSEKVSTCAGHVVGNMPKQTKILKAVKTVKVCFKIISAEARFAPSFAFCFAPCLEHTADPLRLSQGRGQEASSGSPQKTLSLPKPYLHKGCPGTSTSSVRSCSCELQVPPAPAATSQVLKLTDAATASKALSSTRRTAQHN
jgi:hypothetical protein